MKSKLGRILFFGVFLAAGVGFFVFSALPTISTWHAAKTWQEVPAQLISQELKTVHGDDSTTYQALAEYRYQAFGSSYTSSRVAIAGGTDNIGSFHKDLARKLRNIANNGGNLTIWVNPQDPSEALIDRSLRIPLLLFHSIFLLVFGGVGAGGIIYSFITAKKHENLAPEDPSSPWLSKQYWSSATKNSNAKSGSTAMGLFAIAWSVISLAPLGIGIQELQEGNFIALVAFLFPIIGLGLMYHWYKLKRNYSATGVMPLTLDPYPGSIGGQLGGTVKLVNGNPGKLVSSEVNLNCIETYKSGKNTHTKSLWQNNMVPSTQATADGMKIAFSFDIPENLPESQPSDRMPHKTWKLSLSLSFLDDFEVTREYVDLPVFKTATQSRFLSPQAFASNSSATVEATNIAVDNIINVQEDSRGYRLYYPAGRYKWGLGIAVFGLMFVGIGLAIPDLIFNIVFPAIGGVVALSGFYFFANSLDVRIGAEGITSHRNILGITIRKRFIPSFSFKEFREKETHSASSGSKHTQYYAIIAHGQEGEQAVVAEGFKSSAQAQAAIEKLNQLQGY